MFMIDLGAHSYYAVLGISPTATSADIRSARDEKTGELKREQRTSANREQIDERLKVITAAGETLARPERREEYDRANAHLRFFTVQPAAAPMFRRKADRLDVLHRAAKDHLAARSVTLTPMSDLDRDDFSADESPVALLDELLD